MAFLNNQGLKTFLAQIKAWVNSKLENEYAKIEKLPSSHELTLPAGRLKGDIDGDGIISLNDAELVRQHVMGINHLSDDLLALADVTGDGEVARLDYAHVKKFATSNFAVSAVKKNSNISDTQGNWQLYGADDEMAGLWYCDVRLADCEAGDSIVATITDTDGSRLSDASIKIITYEGGSTSDCYLRVITKKVPTTDVPISVNITHDGEGHKTLVYKEPAPAKYQTTVTIPHDSWTLAQGEQAGENEDVYTYMWENFLVTSESVVLCTIEPDQDDIELHNQWHALMRANIRYLGVIDDQAVFGAFGELPGCTIKIRVTVL